MFINAFTNWSMNSLNKYLRACYTSSTVQGIWINHSRKQRALPLWGLHSPWSQVTDNKLCDVLRECLVYKKYFTVYLPLLLLFLCLIGLGFYSLHSGIHPDDSVKMTEKDIIALFPNYQIHTTLFLHCLLSTRHQMHEASDLNFASPFLNRQSLH